MCSSDLDRLDVSSGVIPLPGIGTKYPPEKLQALLEEYKGVSTEQMWSNLEYFLGKLVPVAEQLGLKLALHADDPPRSVFGLPRIIKNIEDHRRVLDIIDSPANGLTLCSGTIGSDLNNDVPAFINEFAARQRVHYRSEEHTSELQSRLQLVCRLLLEKKKKNKQKKQ